MGNLLLRPLRLWVMYLPQLAACYLLGLLGRNIAIELAAKFGWNNYLIVDLIMPFAGLARLGSIIAMFLVLRSAIPSLSVLPKASLRQVDLFSSVVLPFFAIYLAWQMFADDWIAYEHKAMYLRVGAAMTHSEPVLDLSNVPVTNLVWYLIVGAFVLRYALKLRWVESRTPTWFVFIKVYLDALWVFLILSFAASKGVTFFLKPTAWFKERRIVVWADTSRAELFSHFRPLEVIWNVLTSALHIAFSGAAVPLIWLAIAGIVYGTSNQASWRGVLRQVAGSHGDVVADRLAPSRQRVDERLSGFSGDTRKKTAELALSQFGKFRPIADSARLVLHGGFIVLSGYVLIYLCLAWLDMSDSFYRPQMQVGGYLVRGFAWMLGPHSEEYWNAVGPVLAALSGILVASLRICLIASAFAHCVERAESGHQSAVSDSGQNQGEVVDYPDTVDTDPRIDLTGPRI
ncbi:Uncharacterised protein [Mycolicibacterium phlei]|uniref:hypothetical protein n=1 Tax=Mycobacteroides chelonae TaxID=1774 RepID=UPI000618B766|nr:hypothetical protein [Mycobacteroides chelonae]AKC39027.1 hypothetical protein GR01_11240 [Mycobacteroides chelonae]ANA98354.1 hypothetical protein BB28_11770 [Mycobacteroides chelonae CCUG 47445]OLT72163.1 hypothetical protein BKG56_18925 [Mycobacteroides chelonae]VEG16570.1 Uncharacterised protein [Mycolicibacterium phlei]